MHNPESSRRRGRRRQPPLLSTPSPYQARAGSARNTAVCAGVGGDNGYAVAVSMLVFALFQGQGKKLCPVQSGRRRNRAPRPKEVCKNSVKRENISNNSPEQSRAGQEWVLAQPGCLLPACCCRCCQCCLVGLGLLEVTKT